MAKPSQRDARAVANASPLAQAQQALARGDNRQALALLTNLGSAASDVERSEAARLRAELTTDPRALLTSAVVFAVIALAAVLALFSRH